LNIERGETRDVKVATFLVVRCAKIDVIEHSVIASFEKLNRRLRRVTRSHINPAS
jgi:hypothetical protein